MHVCVAVQRVISLKLVSLYHKTEPLSIIARLALDAQVGLFLTGGLVPHQGNSLSKAVITESSGEVGPSDSQHPTVYQAYQQWCARIKPLWGCHRSQARFGRQIGFPIRPGLAAIARDEQCIPQ